MMPNPSKPDAAPKAYARAQVKEVVSLDKFVKHLSEHNGVFTRGSIKGIITDLTECLIEYMLNGYKVTLGDLGSFCPSLSSTGAESIKDFTSHSITAVNIIFTPGEGFENLITRAEFNPVSSLRHRLPPTRPSVPARPPLTWKRQRRSPRLEMVKVRRTRHPPIP